MKKLRHITFVLAIFIIVATLSACDFSKTPSNNPNNGTYDETQSENNGLLDFDELYPTPEAVFLELSSRGYEGSFEEWVESLHGDNGKSAYEIAVEMGYKGTLDDWLASLRGEKGDKGDKGDNGLGIAKVEIVDGYLIITYTDGTSLNAGSVSQDVGSVPSISAGSEGLDFHLLSDGTYAVSKGTANFLEEIVIPDSYRGKTITLIPDGAFNYCQNLKNVILPSGITRIEHAAFSNCPNLKSINIPSTVTFIGQSFEECDIEKVYITDLTAWCNIEFFNNFLCGKLTMIYLNGELLSDVVIPAEITEIKSYTFKNWKSLKSVTIHGNVSSIGAESFMFCGNLESVYIPKSIESIEREAFNYCPTTMTVYYEGSIEDWNNIVFDSGNDNLKNANIIYNYSPQN